MTALAAGQHFGDAKLDKVIPRASSRSRFATSINPFALRTASGRCSVLEERSPTRHLKTGHARKVKHAIAWQEQTIDFGTAHIGSIAAASARETPAGFHNNALGYSLLGPYCLDRPRGNQAAPASRGGWFHVNGAHGQENQHDRARVKETSDQLR